MVFAGDPVAELAYLDEILENMKLTYNPNHFLLIDVYKHAIEAAAKCEEVSLRARIPAMILEANRIANISHGPDHPFTEYVCTFHVS